MIRNYLLVALRNLMKNKSYVIINTLGLGISLACCITAYILLAYNIEFDNFHDEKKVADIYRIHRNIRQADGTSQVSNQACIAVAPAAAAEIAGVEAYTRYVYGNGAMRYGEKAFNENITFVDSTFFDLFDFPLAAGDHSSFKDKYSIFLSKKIAEKYFGDEDPLGKLIVLNFVNDTEVTVTVGGIIETFPVNNSFYLDAVMRMEVFMDYNQIGESAWNDWRDPSTFLKVSSPDVAAGLGKQLAKYIPIHNERRPDVVVESYSVVPFKPAPSQDDVRTGWSQSRISMAPLVIFTSMAVLILLIACFNLTNTSIAMASKRLKEVGVRKAIGAARIQIVSQFLLETVLTIVLALVVGLLMAQVIVPAFTQMWELPYGLTDLNGVNLFTSLIILVFLASLLAGMYPALFGSRFRPTLLLKGNVKIRGTNLLTRTMVGGQFALSLIVLIAGVVFIRNMEFQEGLDYGYDKDGVITMRIQGEREFLLMENALNADPRVLEVGASDGNFGGNNYETPVKVDTDTTERRTQAMGVGKNYFAAMGLRILQGRDFNLDNTTDQSEGIIVNQAFVDKIVLKDPLDKLVVLHQVRRRVVGVVDNHIDNLFRAKDFEPFVFYPTGRNQYINMLVKADPSELGDVQKLMEAKWRELMPGRPFESRYQEDVVLGNSRNVNGNLRQIFLFITVLGGLLSVSGIFALASLNIARRTKEIGVRKAMGATVGNIVRLLNREFVIILGAAVIVGSVSGYYLTLAMLDEIYVIHGTVEVVAIVLCALAIFAIGVFTTSSTIFGAARMNPVSTLRDE